ncbi:MAG TPA: bifunctional diaminohydroxyphosphoribosylaminopyrimidine deaminase/5-amino-6-(5-phosphoribosylamino)uracil reductase RibD [Candidatus Paceibacterota bacterium]|jgi:diaminohydroxyphosphoribosylaminopyrimidine deaminase/5-amino-6-(5-phosphoribosylamino)uracil reductase|nr:bifunctional diaminohydroxyphosphoribosylaminopyrimidine deaminase/5-amino-6-(5-phosphoribosylamino)uracil reductase RibD [Candidatus Paceibacterota bacterium]
MIDDDYMKLALGLARKGQGYASPNPMVGAVLVKNNEIIGKGFHHRCGAAHAEVNAINSARTDVVGATLYVTLEPCCHHGQTPPCTDAIIKSKIRRVVIGSIDANPLVSCRGINQLQASGIEVKTGVLEKECRALNEVFFHYMQTKLPFITLKFAQTLDGRIASAVGNSKWISCDKSLTYAHKLRAQHDAILVGINTVITDNPELTVRHVRGRNPLRVVVDSKLKISPKAKVLQNLGKTKTLIATTKKPADTAFKKISATGAVILPCRADKKGRVDLKDLFKKLAARNISSVLVEGGAQIITSMLRDNLAQRIVVVIAPKILGTGVQAVGDLNIKRIDAAKKLTIQKILKRGDDIIIDSRLQKV